MSVWASSLVGGALRRVGSLVPRRLRRRGLERRVSEHVNVLPLLSGQLRSTAKHIEDAVVAVCASFQEIAGRAQRSVSNAATAVGRGRQSAAGSHTDAVEAIDAAGSTLRQLLDRILRSSDLSTRAASQMERLEQSMQRLAPILNDIDRIAMSTRLLALNAAIEAARSGQHGQAFGVVASEMAQMAADSGRTSQSVRDIVTALIRDVRSVSGELRTVAAADLHDAAESRTAVDQTLAELTSSHQRLQQSVEEAAATSEALARDIAAAVIGLQFQDATSQRIAHVASVLEATREELAAYVTPSAVAARTAGQLSATYTMAAERDVHARHFGAGEHEPVAAAGGTVELF